MKADIEKSAQHLYGLIHARFILTTRGLQKMVIFFYFFQFTTKKKKSKQENENENEMKTKIRNQQNLIS